MKDPMKTRMKVYVFGISAALSFVAGMYAAGKDEPATLIGLCEVVGLGLTLLAIRTDRKENP